MSCLITNLPSVEVWVRKEYLTDHQSGHGEFVKGVWVSAKSIPGRAFYFETYLPEYAAMYDKLPISAFVSSPETPSHRHGPTKFTVLELYGLWCSQY